MSQQGSVAITSDQLKALLQQEKISNIETDKQISLIKWQNKVKKTEIQLFLLLLIFLFIRHQMRKAAIKRQYGDLISWIDKGMTRKPPAYSPKGSGSFFRPGMDGYGTVYWFLHPHLQGNPFLNINFPAAVVYAYYTESFHKKFLGQDCDTNVGTYTHLQQMYTRSNLGPTDDGYSHYESPLAIICHTWGFDCSLKKCELPCTAPNRMSGVDVASSSVSWACNGAMAGSAIFPPIGSIVGGAAGAIFGGVTSGLKKKSLEDQCKKLHKEEKCIENSVSKCT